MGLKKVNFSKNWLGVKSAYQFAKVIRQDNYLRSLQLQNNQFSAEAVGEVVKALEQNKALLSLDLRGNPGYEKSAEFKHRVVFQLFRNLKQAL